MNNNRKTNRRVTAIALQLLVLAIALIYVGAMCISHWNLPIPGGICLWGSGALACAFALLE